MANLACAGANRCAQTWHVPGSRAAMLCARAAGDVDPIPVGPSGALAIAAVRASVVADLKADDAATGWRPRAHHPHPTGGYTHRSVRTTTAGPLRSARTFARVVVMHGNAHGPHRGDGPAVVEYGEDGRCAQVTWWHTGVVHRGDGPSRTIGGAPSAYHWRGVTLADDQNLHGPGVAPLLAAIEELSAAGADPNQVVGWAALGAPNHLRRWIPDLEQVRSWAGAGRELADIEAALDAGLEDPTVITAVATGSLPLSWALAGLGR